MPEREWSRPPTSEEPQALWTALHDASLLGIQSDRLARTLGVQLELGFPEPPEPCPEKVTLALTGVTHALVFVFLNWPGPWPNVVTPITPEMEAAMQDYKRSSRVETADLGVFARWIADDAQVEVIQADLDRAEDGLTLTLDGTTNDPDSGSGWQLEIGAETLDVRLPDGSPLGLERLLRLGKAGWDAWGARAKSDAEPEEGS